VAHEASKQLLSIEYRQLSPLARRLHVHAVGLKAAAPGVPVRKRREQDKALFVRQGGNAELTDGATEKILVLVQLHDVVGWGGIRQKPIPGPPVVSLSALTLAMHRKYLRRRRCSLRETTSPDVDGRSTGLAISSEATNQPPPRPGDLRPSR